MAKLGLAGCGAFSVVRLELESITYAGACMGNEGGAFFIPQANCGVQMDGFCFLF